MQTFGEDMQRKPTLASRRRPITIEQAMTTVLITEQADSSYVRCAHSGVRGRLTMRLRAWTLDTQLASGACPDSSAALSLRAQKLIGRNARRQLSGELRRLLREAERGPDPLKRGIPICRDDLICARAELEELSDRLAGSAPVDAAGVARVRLLLRDGCGPLYNRRRSEELEEALQEALDGLSLRRVGRRLSTPEIRLLRGIPPAVAERCRRVRSSAHRPPCRRALGAAPAGAGGQLAVRA